MINISARNVAEAWGIFVRSMTLAGGELATREVSARGMRTLEILEPVSTRYSHPVENVLLDPVRDANPFLHLYEALYLLAGFDDVQRLVWYNPRMAEFSDNGSSFHGAYGHRLAPQIHNLIQLLQEDPDSRRGVLQIWNSYDLNFKSNDLPCNTAVYAKIRDGALNITVTNRSNDAVWGCFGANAVQFSILQQYLAAALGVGVGVYHQVSDSLHVYLEGDAGKVWDRCRNSPPPLYSEYTPEATNSYVPELVFSPGVRGEFMKELRTLLSDPSGAVTLAKVDNAFLKFTALPMLLAFSMYRLDMLRAAIAFLSERDTNNLWIRAGLEWLTRRSVSREKRDVRPV